LTRQRRRRANVSPTFRTVHPIVTSFDQAGEVMSALEAMGVVAFAFLLLYFVHRATS
jgi:hypothetical protein